MKIKIKSKSVNAISDVISYCLFSAFREHDDSVRNIKVIDQSCEFYQKLKSVGKAQKDVCFFADDTFCSALCCLIEEHIYDAAADLANDQMEWLCDVMDFYHQLLPAKKDETVLDYEEEMKKKRRKEKQKDEREEDEKEEDSYFEDMEL